MAAPEVVVQVFDYVAVAETVEQVGELSAVCAKMPMWTLPEEELLAALEGIHAAKQMLHAALLHVVREIDGRGIPAAQAASSAAVWLRGRLRISPRRAARLVAHARLLDADSILDRGISEGRINTEQLAAIANTLDNLPDKLDQETRQQASEMLAGWAPRLDPHGLRTSGRRILEHVAPEIAEASEEERLRRAEQRARRQRYRTVSPLGDGRVLLRGILDTESAATVSAALDPLCRPDRAAAEMAETGETRTPAQRRADALVEVCRIALTGGGLPENGGDRPQMAVTVSFDPLRRELTGGRLDTGETVSASAVRRIACDARILPIIMGGDSQVLDAGRARRLVTGTLRRAIVVRDEGCTFPGCDRPARWCDAHHIVGWAAGGTTELGNLALLCEHHHRLVHDERSGWEVRLGADGRPEFLPPEWMDSQRTPRTNPFHRRT